MRYYPGSRIEQLNPIFCLASPSKILKKILKAHLHFSFNTPIASCNIFTNWGQAYPRLTSNLNNINLNNWKYYELTIGFEPGYHGSRQLETWYLVLFK